MRAFDRSQIPIEIQKLNGPLLDRMEAEATAKLQDPNYRWATAIHEAAHFFYMKKAGALRPIFFGPHFIYDDETKKIQVAVASTGCEWPQDAKLMGSRIVARWQAAGGLWEKELTDSADAEESSVFDRSRFGFNLRKAHPDVNDAEIENTWFRACEEVRKDLKDEAIKEEILKVAEAFKKCLEGLLISRSG
jgi:hypothetical protein